MRTLLNLVDTQAEQIAELEKALVAILKSDKSKYSDPIEALDAIYALAFFVLPEEKQSKPTPNIIVSQIGLGKALQEKKKPPSVPPFVE